MGSPATELGHGRYCEPLTRVTLTTPFNIQQFELTQAQWTALGLDNPSKPSASPDTSGDCVGAQCPVGNVSWFEALAFANLLSKQSNPPLPECYELEGCTGTLGHGMTCAAVKGTTLKPYLCGGFRLPTNAEWEYAARAGTAAPFYSGDFAPGTTEHDAFTCDGISQPGLDRIAWYCKNSGVNTHPVGGKEPNPWGLYDMLGNAEEWIHDHFRGHGYGVEAMADPENEIVMGSEITRLVRVWRARDGLAHSPAVRVAGEWEQRRGRRRAWYSAREKRARAADASDPPAPGLLIVGPRRHRELVEEALARGST